VNFCSLNQLILVIFAFANFSKRFPKPAECLQTSRNAFPSLLNACKLPETLSQACKMPENFLNRFCKLEKRLQILKNAFTGMQNVREFTATISRACPDFEFFRDR